MKKEYKFETKAIRQQVEQSSQREHSVPIYATSSFTFENAEHARAVFAEEEDGNVYTRFTNPNNDEFVAKLIEMEGAEDGLATSSGMAAVFLGLVSFLRAGDHIVASRSLFGSSHQVLVNILPRWGITHTYIDSNADSEEWEEAIMPQTRLLFVETPSNPGLDVLDLKQLADLAESNDCLLVVDNCFATPYLQKPIDFGAHIVCHSATKFIDGQGRTMGGAILGSEDTIAEARMFARQTGPTMSPFNAWILSKSLETLAVRMDRHCSNAFTLAKHLKDLKDVAVVRYPFLDSHEKNELAKKQMTQGGGLVTFSPTGDYQRCLRFVDALEMFSVTSNLGDSRTTVTHPASTTHSKLSVEEKEAVGITETLLRVSVGLEHIDDIIGDIEQALDKSK